MKLRTTILLLTLMLGLVALGQAQSIHYPIGKNMLVSSAFTTAPVPVASGIDPLFVVHQDAPGGKLSSFITRDEACVAAIQATPDNGVSPNGKTFSLGYSPYITVTTQTLQNSVYIGLDFIPPPTCAPPNCK